MAMVQRRPIGEQHTAAVRCDEPSVRRVVDVVSHTIRTHTEREREHKTDYNGINSARTISSNVLAIALVTLDAAPATQAIRLASSHSKYSAVHAHPPPMHATIAFNEYYNQQREQQQQ